MYNQDGQISNIDLTFGENVPAAINKQQMPFVCSVAHKNRMWVIGGQYIWKRQVSEVTDCAVRKVGELDFDLLFGSCASAHDQLYLCFDKSGDGNVCRRGSDPLGSFSLISSTAHAHSTASMASSES